MATEIAKRIARRMSGRQFLKYWCFTLNNPTIEDHPPNIWDDVEYVIWQHEQGENGTEHLQGYVCFKIKKSMSWLKKECSDRAHWEMRNGDHQAAKHYCMKPVAGCDCQHCDDCPPSLGGPWTYGDDSKIPTKKGQRTDIRDLYDALKGGAKAIDIMLNPDMFGMWCRYYRAIDRFILDNEPKRNWITFTQVYWGVSGCGKTRRAHYEAGLKADGTPGEPYYVLRKPQGGGVYWDGYNGEKHIIIDEFYGWIPRTQMQVLCDRYPAVIDIKLGARNFVPTKIWITSNEAPKDWWKNIGLGAMERRLTGEFGSVVYMTQPWAPPGEIPAPLPMVVPPIFSPPAVGQVVVPMLALMQRHTEDEAAEAAAYERIRIAEEEEGQRMFDAWMNNLN